MPKAKYSNDEKRERSIEKKNMPITFKFSKAQAELIHMGGTAEFYRKHMIEQAKQSLDMNIEYRGIEVSE